MAIENIQKVITLDVYDHNTTTSTIKTIACDNDTRYVAAEIRNEGKWLDIGPDSDVRLTIIRPDKVGVSISGEPYPFDYSHGDGTIDPETGQESIVADTYYGAYAELTQAAIAVAGVIYAQFKITNGSQILRTEIFQINNGRALDVEPDSWAGEYERYDVIATELLERMEAAEEKANQASSDIRGYASRIASAEAKLNNIADINAENSSLIITTSTPSSQKRLTPSYITDSASGAIARFVDGADDVPLKSLKVNIVPAQSGSGDPSPDNVRPISGFNSVKVTRAGKNLAEINDIDIPSSVISTVDISGVVTLPKGTYTLSWTFAGTVTATKNQPLFLANGAQVYSGVNSTADGRYSWTFTLDEDTSIILRWWYHTVSSACKASEFMLEYGNKSTEFEHYNGSTYDVSLASAGTVYGGTLDVVSGELTVDRKSILVDGTQDIRESQVQRFFIGIADTREITLANQNTDASVISERFKSYTWGGLTKAMGCAPVYGFGVAFRNPAITTVSAWKEFFQNNPTRFVYMLATPITYNLTPIEVKSLLGINNVWSDAGDMDVEYRADTKLYIDKKMGG